MSDLLRRFLAGDRRALAQAITLVESDNPEDRIEASNFITQIKVEKPTLRIALSGPPGVGKSTLINVLGKQLREHNLSVAILPIDPASEIHRGSILADKTRMSSLLGDKEIYIRPSSSRAVMGGVSHATHDVVFLVESFGFDVVIIETVGVGQSESLAYSLSDYFILLMQPGAGDQLQALKKGILERADMIVVNKWDTTLKALAESSYKIIKANVHVPTFLLSAMTEEGVDEFVSSLLRTHEQEKSAQNQRRKDRMAQFFYFALEKRIMEKIFQEYELKDKGQKIMDEIITHKLALGPKIENLLEEIFSHSFTKSK